MNKQQSFSYSTKFGLVLTAVSLVGLVILSIVFHDDDDDNTIRHLDDGTISDYSSYQCDTIYQTTPDPGQAQCQFARTCGGGSGIWAPIVYCSVMMSPKLIGGILAPFIALWLLLLFRMLGSTAEDYFSPALELFSMQLGLPPRFAGVSLLALGNGAADVSATVSAISSDPNSGYKLSLGALTGAAMFIASVVSAVVIITNDGVPCRGALVRDVLALLVTVGVVWNSLSSRGIVDGHTITLFLSLYCMFVCLVLVADIYHRAVVMPRQLAMRQELERHRQLHEQRLAQVASQRHLQSVRQDEEEETGADASMEVSNLPQVVTTAAEAAITITPPPSTVPTSRQRRPTMLANVLTALSNYDRMSTRDIFDSGGWGVEGDELPTRLHGAHGLLSRNSTPSATSSPYTDATQEGRRISDATGETSFATATQGGGSDTNLMGEGVNGDYTIMNDPPITTTTSSPFMPDRHDTTTILSTSPTWNDTWQAFKCQVEHHGQTVWEDIYWNGDLHPIERFLQLLELPFIFLRQITVALPCPGFYVPGMVACALACSPPWFAWYLHGHDYDIWNASGTAISLFFCYWLLMIVMGVLVLRFGPTSLATPVTGRDRYYRLFLFQVPVALYGFVMAATWIDTIADALVSVLNFIGIVLQIPRPILGLTLLAWGNSMSDLSANITMARKGLANMAMTACFAGPVFNILVGLGMGFSSLAAHSGVPQREVTLAPSVLTGFAFVALNAAAILTAGLLVGTSGRIVKEYGYVALVLYGIYVVTSITLQYYPGFGDDD